MLRILAGLSVAAAASVFKPIEVHLHRGHEHIITVPVSGTVLLFETLTGFNAIAGIKRTNTSRAVQFGTLTNDNMGFYFEFKKEREGVVRITPSEDCSLSYFLLEPVTFCSDIVVSTSYNLSLTVAREGMITSSSVGVWHLYPGKTRMDVKAREFAAGDTMGIYTGSSSSKHAIVMGWTGVTEVPVVFFHLQLEKVIKDQEVSLLSTAVEEVNNVQTTFHIKTGKGSVVIKRGAEIKTPDWWDRVRHISFVYIDFVLIVLIAFIAIVWLVVVGISIVMYRKRNQRRFNRGMRKPAVIVATEDRLVGDYVANEFSTSSGIPVVAPLTTVQFEVSST